jgi:hypothetical protein
MFRALHRADMDGLAQQSLIAPSRFPSLFNALGEMSGGWIESSPFLFIQIRLGQRKLVGSAADCSLKHQLCSGVLRLGTCGKKHCELGDFYETLRSHGKQEGSGRSG